MGLPNVACRRVWDVWARPGGVWKPLGGVLEANKSIFLGKDNTAADLMFLTKISIRKVFGAEADLVWAPKRAYQCGPGTDPK